MLAKWATAFIFGFIFVLLLDFLLFVGLKLNYFDYYGIDIYFNTLFADNQPYLLLLIVSTLLGYAMLYLRGNVIFDRIYIVLVLLFATTFYLPIGRAAGEFLFAEKAKQAQLLDRNEKVDILYRGRNAVYVKKPTATFAVKYRYSEIKLPD